MSVRRRLARLVVTTFATLVFACTAAERPLDLGADVERPDPWSPMPFVPDARIGPDALPDAPPPTPGPFEIAIAGRVAPPSQHFRGFDPVSVSNHATLVGWSQDGTEIAYCIEGDGAACDTCVFTARDGTSETLETGSDCSRPVPPEVIQARLTDRGYAVRDATWAWGGDVVVAIETRQGAVDSSNTPRARMRASGRVREAGAAGRVLDIDSCFRAEIEEYCAFEIHPEAVLISPDGQTIAVLAHAFAGEFTDRFVLELVPAGRFAAQAYAAASR